MDNPFNRKKKTIMPVGATIPPEVQGNFNNYMDTMKKATGKTDVEILNDIFTENGWLTLSVEETGANLRLAIESSQLMGQTKTVETKDPILECMRLRNNFAPVSSCVEYIKQQLIGGGIDVVINNPKNKIETEIKDDLITLINDIYQDVYTIGLDILLPILIDYSLTTGKGIAEITYLTDKNFWDYAEVEAPLSVTVDKKTIQTVSYKITEPNWTELKGIKRLKIFPDGYKRFVPQRDQTSMEIEYWSVEEKSESIVRLADGTQLRKFDSKNPRAGTYLHNWQLFCLSLNRQGQEVGGTSIILPVYNISTILERILGAVGEGLYRAGNKRYFVVMGSEKRPWGGPFIRNVLQQMKEAKEKNWSVIPMPMGFDLKEMGGEVFDAKDVVNYFKATIAKGMGCPAKIVGVELRGEEKDDVPSLQLYKANLLSAIRNQLFKYHIWTLHGKVRTKQGKNNSEEVFVPNPRIKVEGLLSLKERTKLFQDVLNVANPLHPLTKMKAEIEFCKLMGWDEVVEELPTIKDYGEELKKAKEEMAKQLKEKAQAPPNTNNPLDEKMQGQPKPQTVNQQQIRLKGMQNKGQSTKGQSKELGTTRVPKDVQETLEEPVTIQPIIEQPPQKLEITVKTESSPQKIEITNKPTEVILKSEPQRIILEQSREENDLVNKQRILLEKETELVERQKSIEEIKLKETREDNIRKLENEKTLVDAELQKIKREVEKINLEIDENKKTEETKREAVKKLSED